MVLKISNLTKKFGGNLAVDQVSFEIGEGEIFSLIGPNGSGKTTIIKVAAGLLKPTAGGVFIGGFDIRKKPVQAKSLIGYIPDEPSVWPEMTGEEFLNFSGALFGLGEKERQKRIPELLKVFGLDGISRGYFGDYSRGNKQKFAIMAALIHEPKLLLIDEPIVGLDPESAEAAKKLFTVFAKQRGSVLIVTHTLSVAQEISGRIGVLRAGKLVRTGTFRELQKEAGLNADASLEEAYLKLTRG